MNNKKQAEFRNHWLDMQQSVEENLKYYHRQPEKNSRPVAEAAVYPPAALPHRGGHRQQALQAEYALLTEQVMPTLARINQRAAARQLLLGGEPPLPQAPDSEETMHIALRAAQKRRR